MNKTVKWLIAGAVVVLAIILVWLFAFSNVFAVKEVSVVGAEGELAQSILAAGAVPMDTPLARLDASAIAERVRSVPQVAGVEVRRGWPSTVVLAVDQRVPVAVVQTPGGWMLTDATGVEFEQVATKPDGLLEVAAEGVGLETAVQVINELPPEIADRVAKVAATTRDDVVLSLKSGAEVQWGSSEQTAFKSKVLVALLAQKAKAYDVSAPELPTTEK